MMLQPRLPGQYYKRIPSIYYIERESQLLKKEKIPAERWLKWLYHDPLGNIALESIIKQKALSQIYGRYMDSAVSVSKIKPFIEMFEINMDESQKRLKDFRSFNDFFYRKLVPQARKIDKLPSSVVSPADGKLLAFQNLKLDQHFVIKGYDFSLIEFLNDDSLALQYVSRQINPRRLSSLPLPC